MKIFKGILLALFLLISCTTVFAAPVQDEKVQEIQKQIDTNKPEVQQPVLVAPADNTAGEQQSSYVTKEELYEKLHENKQKTIELANTEVANITSYFSALIGFLAVLLAIIALFVGWAGKKLNSSANKAQELISKSEEIEKQLQQKQKILDQRLKQTEEYQEKLNKILTSKEFDEKIKEIDNYIKNLKHSHKELNIRLVTNEIHSAITNTGNISQFIIDNLYDSMENINLFAQDYNTCRDILERITADFHAIIREQSMSVDEKAPLLYEVHFKMIEVTKALSDIEHKIRMKKVKEKKTLSS